MKFDVEKTTHTLNCLWKWKKQTLVLKILCGNSCTFAAGRWGTFIMFLFKNFSLVPVKPILAFDKKFGEILKVFIHSQLMDFHSPLQFVQTKQSGFSSYRSSSLKIFQYDEPLEEAAKNLNRQTAFCFP